MNDDLISRQAAIDALEWTWAGKAAFDAIKNLPSAQPRWIPVSERLPDEDYLTGANVQHSAEVLMTVYNAEDEVTIIDYGHTVSGSWYSDITDCPVPCWWEVTAWMPLPQPWEGADDD